MSNEIYFTRPGELCEIADRLKSDILYAQNRIMGAYYNLSNSDIIHTINQSCAPVKQFIVDDISFDWSKIYQSNHYSLGVKEDVLMHHKFMIIDDVVWLGSFNITRNATSLNWENVLRTSEHEVLDRCLIEFKHMIIFAMAFENHPSIWQKKFNGTAPYLNCGICTHNLKDPFEHYRIHIQLIRECNWAHILDGKYYCENREIETVKPYQLSECQLECVNPHSTHFIQCKICSNYFRQERLHIISTSVNMHVYDVCDINFLDDGDGHHTEEYVYGTHNEDKVMTEGYDKHLCWNCLYNVIAESWLTNSFEHIFDDKDFKGSLYYDYP